MIQAKVLCDSVHQGNRITTLEVVYPRMIHSEMLRHRMFSRNVASSRAIPVHKVLREVIKNPAMTCHYGKKQKGMQAYEELTGWRRCRGAKHSRDRSSNAGGDGAFGAGDVGRWSVALAINR